MRTHKLTAAQAIQRNYLLVMLPSVILVLVPFIVGFQLLNVVEGESVFRSVNLVPFLIMVLGFPFAIFISSIVYTNWFVRSFLAVDHPALLYKHGVLKKMITPKGSIFNKLHVMLGVSRADYDKAWSRIKQLGDPRDLKEQLPAGGELIVKGSSSAFYINSVLNVLMIAVFATSLYLSKDSSFVYLMVFLLLAVIAYYTRKSLMLYRNMNKTKLIFNPKGLGIEGKLIPWSAIVSFKVVQVTRYKTQLEVISFETTQVNTYNVSINDLDEAPSRINDLMTIYIDVYSNRPAKPGATSAPRWS